MRAFRSVLAFSTAAAAIAASSLALADVPRVLLVGLSPAHPTIARVREELEALGVDVVWVQGESESNLAALAREHHAAAAARVEDWPPEIVVWVEPAEPTSDPSQGLEIRVSESLVGHVESALLALRATELLRGKLLPIAPAAQPDAATATPAPNVRAAAPRAPAQLPPVSGVAQPRGAVAHRATRAPARSRPESELSAKGTRGYVSTWVAAAVLLSPGGLPATPEIRLGAGYRPLSRLGFEATAFIPPASATVLTRQGAIDLRTFAFGGNLVLAPTNPAAEFAMTACLGAAGLLLLFEGHAQPPFASARGSRWAALPYAGVGMSYRLHPFFAARADAVIGFAMPEPVVRAAARAVATIGLPATFLSLGIEMRL